MKYSRTRYILSVQSSPDAPNMEKRGEELDDEMKRWWTSETVAVVTGANRGIGLEIVRQMASKGLTVVLTSRNQQRGSAATQSLLQQGFHSVFFHRLDVQSSDSISQFAQWLHNKFGGLDILINNAGVIGLDVDWESMEKQRMDMRALLFDAVSDETTIFDYESTSMCIDINYYGTKRTVKALMPLLRPSAARPRIVNVSSLHGLLEMLPNQTLRTQLSDVSNVNEEFIDSMLNRFLEDVKASAANLKERGWPVPFSGYKMSKIGVNTYTRLLAAQMGDTASVNCIHPGYVSTDMTFNTGDLSVVEGAANVVGLALLPPGGPSGHNFLEQEISRF